MMVGDAAMERVQQINACRLQAPAGEIGKAIGLGFAAISALRIARPLTPTMSLITCVSFRLASSSVF